MLLSFLFSKDVFILILKASAILLVTYAVGSGIYNRYFHPYRKYPGPWLASITPLWYFWQVRNGNGENYQLGIHKKYGQYVRITPDHIQISDVGAIDTIYGPKGGFTRTDFYESFDPKISKRKDMFTTRDWDAHAYRRRCVSHIYTQGAVLEYEPCVDRVIALFYARMQGFANEGAIVDMSVWLRKYTFDVIGEIFHGREGGFGFLRDNIDYSNWCYLMDIMQKPVAGITYVPYGFRTLYFMTQLFWPETREAVMGLNSVIQDSHKAVKLRLDAMAAGQKVSQTDVLAKLLQVVEDKNDPEAFGIPDVTVEIWAVIWAGSDTTATALTSFFYHVHKHPHVLERLLEEIDHAFETNTLTYPVRYSDASKLPYLNAVIMESMRFFSSLGTGYPRVVPKGGADICGRWFPGGQKVIMNQNAVAFDKGVYGQDSEVYNPDRWLRSKEEVNNMRRNFLQFGYGPTVCIGQYITWIEMYKVLPTVLRDFNFELQPGEWTQWQGWFAQTKNVNTRITRRRPIVRGEGYDAIALKEPLKN